MSCATCGTGLPEGTTVCTVCDPWAVTAAAPAVATASASSAAGVPALPAAEDVPKWILRLAKRHRPANVGYQQLERAWRNTVVVSSIRLTSYGIGALGFFFAFVARIPVAAAICFLLAACGYIAVSCYALALKRNFWLGRAVALAGAQPALGYAGLARIPGIAKITRSINVIRVLSIVVLGLRLFLTDDHALPSSLSEGSWALYIVFFGALTVWHLRLQAQAHRELAGRLVVRR